MNAEIIDGKRIAALKEVSLQKEVAQFTSAHETPPTLAVILVGEDPASQVYVRRKQEACKRVGIGSLEFFLPKDISQTELLTLITQLNQDRNTHGILVQLPLPKQIDTNLILDTLHADKDVDGFHPLNLGLLAQRRPRLRPCTPYGVMQLLESIHYDVKGKHAVVIGSSTIVGRPMALELLLAQATVTVCHSATKDLSEHVKQADILVSAVGKPGLVLGEWIKPQAAIFDVGITRLSSGKLAGDIQFEEACKRAGFITPVPGGVGPMTVTTLLQNTLLAASLQKNNNS